jgi:hypothetical protein
MKDLLYRLVDTGLSRPKAVAVLGVAVTGEMRRMRAEEVGRRQGRRGEQGLGGQT